MKRVYIFTIHPERHESIRFLEALEEMGYEGLCIQHHDVKVVLNGDETYVTHNNEKLPLPEAVILRAMNNNGMKDCLIKFYRSHGVRVLNSENLLQWPIFGKATQHIGFSQAGIPYMSSTISIRPDSLLAEKSDYPYIIKSSRGTHGDQVYKINGPSDSVSYDKILAPYLKQPFSTAGEDLRVVVLGYQTVGAMLRKAKKGAYLTNFSAGGEVSMYDLDEDPEIKEIAEKCARYFKCEYAGVDLMKNQAGEWIVLEVNRTCEFKGFEQVTQMDFAKKVIEYLLLDPQDN